MSQLKLYAFADEASPMISGQIAAMKRNGLDGLEIRGVDNVNVSDISLKKAKEVRQQLADNGLIVWSIGSPIGKIPIGGDHATHIETFKRTLEIAEVLEAQNFRLFSYYLDEGADPSRFRSQVIDRMGELLQCAKGTNVRICHENEKGIYGDNAERCYDLLAEFPDLYGIFDPANYIQCGQDTSIAWNLLKERIAYLHIKDALYDGTVVPAGHGQGHISEILHDFMDRGGDAVTIEPHLQAFSGLEHLERQGETSLIGSEFHYKSLDESFDAACNALKALI